MNEAYWNILEKFKRTLPLNDAERALVNQRAAEIKGLYLLEEGKCKLTERKFEKARQLILEANTYLHSSKLSLAALGLGVAPNATGRLISLWEQIRNGTSV
jgi:hypothetical protein